MFVFAQNPQLSLLNKNMHYTSQQINTISKYILQYVLSETGIRSQRRSRTIFESYTRIRANEAVVILIFRKIKNLSYRILLDMAFRYKWRNVLRKLRRMYVVIDGNAFTILYKGTLFMNEDEYLDIDIDDLIFDDSEFLRELADIKISETLYFRPLIASSWIYPTLGLFSITINLDIKLEKEGAEMFMDICSSKIRIPKEIAGPVGIDVRFIDSKVILYYILSCAHAICQMNNLELLKQVLNLKISTKFTFQELELLEEYSEGFNSRIPTHFIKMYEYETKMELLVYITCSYHSIHQNRKELIKFLEDNYHGDIYQQILFDAAINHRKDGLVKEYIFKVESNSENIRKITGLAFEKGNVDLIRLILSQRDELKGDLNESALKAVINKKEYELVQEIISKYPNTVNIFCLEKAVEIGDIRIAKLLIEFGVDVKSPGFKGVRIASKNMDIRMLQLLSENHAFVEILDRHDIIRLCSIENSEIAKRLLEFSNEDRDKSKTPEIQVKKGKGLNYSKAMLCLIEACQNYVLSCINERAGPEDVVQSEDRFEELRIIINSSSKNMTIHIHSYCKNLFCYYFMLSYETTYYHKLVEIIDYIVENNLQNTLNDTEYDEKNDVKDKNIVEMSINGHYELAKSELVNRNFGELKLLIEYGIDANANGSLILRTAYKAGDICWIGYFISKGMKLEGESDGFEEACKSDKVEVLEHWIKNEGVVPKNSRYLYINMACLLGNFDIVKLLVDNGMDLSDPKRNGVRIACRLGIRRTLKYLLDNNAAIDGTCHYQLEYACMIEDIGLVKMILEYYDSLGVLKKRENIDMKGRGKVLTESFLNIESSNCFEEYWITKTLLERGEPIQNIDFLEAVKTSIKTDNIEILKILLTYNIDLNSDYKILMFAVQVGNIEVVKLLLKNGLSVKNNSSIVDVALETNNVDMIRLLLQYGAEVLSCSLQLKYFNIDDIETLHLMLDCCPDIVGASPLLQSAIEKNNLEVVKLLLRDPATLGNYVYDFVYYACRSNNIEILKLLFEKGKNTKRESESGVIQVCENNNLEMLKLLLERNPHLVLFEEYGLKEAIDNENVEMIKLLIKYGVDMSGHTVSIMKVASGLNDNELLSICQNVGTGN